MDNIRLKVEERKIGKKSELKKLRKSGKIPAIFYTGNEDPVPITVDYKEFQHLLSTGTHLVEMEIGGKVRKTLIKEIQYHPVTDRILHVDFYGVTGKAEVEIELPLIADGTAIGVKEYGGYLEQYVREIPVKCPVDEIPEAIHVDVSALNVGDSISVKELDLGKTRVMLPEDTVLFYVSGGKVEVTKEEEEEGEEEAEQEE